ncbi:hypothetical protein M9Y10_008766 [Tritrichomonas musculus]|uniref:IPT/TIG domain-containing protein n=1 Tax=Tritrichomonas musculus TaxID=1915356 RepID=A0ABR2IYZ5_9EUKA
MLFIFFCFFKLSLQYDIVNPESTFCICQNSKTINCQNVCQNLKQLKFTQKSIKKSLKLTKHSPITFLIFGTEEIQPDFNLTLFENRSFTIISPSQNESIILFPGEANAGITHSFIDTKIKLKSGVFNFYKLRLIHSEINPYSDKNTCEIEEDYLDFDYYSLNAISERIYLRPPTSGVKLFCQQYVKQIQFLNDQKIVFGNDTSNFIDFSQIERNGNTTIILNSNEITFTFSQLPTTTDFFPKITFFLKRSTKIFIDEEQFPDEVMELQKYITIEHSDRTIYIESRPGTNPPQFHLVGSGKALYNNKEIKFSSSYCLCEDDSCQKICGSQEIVKFDEIDTTVVGNSIPSLTYCISGTTDQKMPTFDFEHFSKKNLSIVGTSKEQHINVTGDTADDSGHYKLSGIILHSNRNLHFNDITFSKVYFRFDRKSEEAQKYFLKANRLNIDFTTLSNLWDQKIELIPPSKGIGVHTTNIIKEEVKIVVLSSTVISIQNINVSVAEQSDITVYCDGAVNFLIDSKISTNLSNFPKIKIFAEGDINTVNFAGFWPKELSDISAKLTVIHGENPLYVQGDFDGTKYKFNPPIIDHEGIGPIFFNGVLSNYKDSFCVCEGPDCSDICEDESLINFSTKSISSTVFYNPTRTIEYTIKNSDSKSYPVFDLNDFVFKSFIIQSENKRSTIGILPSKNRPDSSISHFFKNVKIVLIENFEYQFGQLELETVSFSKLSKSFDKAKIIQSGMIVDFTSIESLQSNQLLTPCHLFQTVNGGIKLNKIEIKKNNKILLCSSDSCVKIDVENIRESVPTFNTLYGSSERRPFIFILPMKSSDIPKIQLDVSQVENGNSYIEFESIEFSNENHVLADKITVIHGLNNIHIMTPYEDGKFIGEPPHISLVGEADYYINEVKQVSVYVAPDHMTIENDDDRVSHKTSNAIAFVGFTAFGLFILCFIIYKKKNKKIHEVIPAMTMVEIHDKEDDQLSSFIDLEDEQFET